MDRSRFSLLPPEVQSVVLSYLPLNNVSPSVSRVLSPSVVDDQYNQIKRRAPEDLLDRITYYASIGYLYGIQRDLANIILDEGVLPFILREVGKRGDTTMLTYLTHHGAVNIEQALVGGILTHQNTFVRQYLNTPLTTLRHLLEAAVIGDNLEMARELIPRCSGEQNSIYLITNRTSLWIHCVRSTSDLTMDIAYPLGFGVLPTRMNDIRDREGIIDQELVSLSMRSDLSEPLPFTYQMLEGESLNYLQLCIGVVEDLLDGFSIYSRLEWILDAAARKASRTLHIPTERALSVTSEAPQWVTALLPLIGVPAAATVLEKARLYLGEMWSMYIDPIGPLPGDSPTMRRVHTMLGLTGPGRHTIRGYVPIQPEVLSMWLNRCLDNIDNSEWPDIRGSTPRKAGISFITKYHPRAKKYVRGPTRRSDRKVYSLTVEQHDHWIRMYFARLPVYTLCKLLEYQLLDLYNELIPQLDRACEEMPIGEREPRWDNDIIRVATSVGLNSVVESLITQFEQPPVVVLDDYPRLLTRLGLIREARVMLPHPRMMENIGKADQFIIDNERFITERLRYVVTNR